MATPWILVFFFWNRIFEYLQNRCRFCNCRIARLPTIFKLALLSHMLVTPTTFLPICNVCNGKDGGGVALLARSYANIWPSRNEGLPDVRVETGFQAYRYSNVNYPEIQWISVAEKLTRALFEQCVFYCAADWWVFCSFSAQYAFFLCRRKKSMWKKIASECTFRVNMACGL